MGKRLWFVLALLLFALLAAGAAESRAEVIYSNFDVGMTWPQYPYWEVYVLHFWDKWAPNGEGIARSGYAVEFSPTASATFTAAQVPLRVWSGNVTVSLRTTGMDGGPGTVLEQFDLAVSADPATRIYTVTSVLRPWLREGVNYWLSLFPANDSASVYWMPSTSGGTFGRLSNYLDGPIGWTVSGWRATVPAIRIQGETAIAVDLDIKPGDVPNSINPRNKGVIPVAILSSPTFDVATVDPKTVRFGRTGTEAAPVQFALVNLDEDGFIDMVLHFRTQDTGIVCGVTTATLTGMTTTGQKFRGVDQIDTVGCK